MVQLPEHARETFEVGLELAWHTQLLRGLGGAQAGVGARVIASLVRARVPSIP